MLNVTFACTLAKDAIAAPKFAGPKLLPVTVLSLHGTSAGATTTVAGPLLLDARSVTFAEVTSVLVGRKARSKRSNVRRNCDGVTRPVHRSGLLPKFTPLLRPRSMLASSTVPKSPRRIVVQPSSH